MPKLTAAVPSEKVSQGRAVTVIRERRVLMGVSQKVATISSATYLGRVKTRRDVSLFAMHSTRGLAEIALISRVAARVTVLGIGGGKTPSRGRRPLERAVSSAIGRPIPTCRTTATSSAAPSPGLPTTEGRTISPALAVAYRQEGRGLPSKGVADPVSVLAETQTSRKVLEGRCTRLSRGLAGRLV